MEYTTRKSSVKLRYIANSVELEKTQEIESKHHQDGRAGS